MLYKRSYISNVNYDSLIESINKYYYDYRLASVVYNATINRYVAFLEKEIK